MDFPTIIYVFGGLSGVHLVLGILTGKSVHRHDTVDQKEDPQRYKADLLTSLALVVLALVTWLLQWIFGF